MFLIKLYQIFFSSKIGKVCLFKESCSKYVYRSTKEEGFIRGIKAFKYRFQNCNSKHQLIELESKKFLLTNKYELVGLERVNENILHDIS